MGCNCGDNEYNITVDNNGNCEPTTPIYNITLANVGVNGYSPIVRFVNETVNAFNIAVDNVTGTETSPAVPKLSYVSDQLNNINTTITNLGSTYLTVNGSNANNPITINGIKLRNSGYQAQLTTDLSTLNIRNTNGGFITMSSYGTIIGTNGYLTLGNGNASRIMLNPAQDGKAYYGDTTTDDNEIATIGNIPTKTSDLTNDSGFITSSDLPTVGNGTITLTQGGVTKGTFTTNQSGNTTIELEDSGVTNPLTITDEVSNNFLQFAVNDSGSYIRTGTQGLALNGYLINTVDNPLSLNDVAFGLKAISLKYDNDTIKVNQDGQLYADISAPTYTAGTGIDITNDTISVDNTVAMKTDIPTVNNGTVTINQGGTQKGTFTLNQSGNTTIDLDVGGGTVDQTFDGTSANAQSGVAISNAKFIQNTATETNSLTILGTASNHLNSINIGVGSIVHGQYATAIGYNANCGEVYATAIGCNTGCGSYSTAIGYNANSGDYSTAIGYNAKALSNNSAIQIGYGTNTTANTLNIGFYNSSSKQYNWRLLDGTTGLIPDARISTNIARTSQIPTNISALINDSGYTSNIGTVTKVNNISPDSNGNVTISIPSAVTETTVSGWGFTKNTGTVTSVNNVSPVNGNVTLSIPSTTNLANKDLSNLSSTGNSKFQTPLVSGTNIKTINNTSLLGSGNIAALVNTATKSTSLTIGDNASTLSYTTNVGIGSQATATAGQAFGHYAIASGQYSLALGQGAEASSDYAIQLGKGTNSTAKSLMVGFGTNGNYQLLNGATGLIPDARISSNIARANDIPDVSNLADTDLSNLSATGQAVIDGKVSKSGDTMTGALNLDMTTVGSTNENFQDIQFVLDDIRRAGLRCSHLTNGTNKVEIIVRDNSGTLASGYTAINNNGTLSCSFPNTKCVDGQWVAKQTTTIVSDGTSLKGNSALKYTVQVPNDGHVYEILVEAKVTSGTTSGDYAPVYITTNQLSDNLGICTCRTRSSSAQNASGIAILPIKYGSNNFILARTTNYAGSVQIRMFGYRRVGTNS